MKNNLLKKAAVIFVLLLLIPGINRAQVVKESKKSSVVTSRKPGSTKLQIEEKNVRAEMGFLASDALQGRGSGTQFEWLAGQYIASQLQQFGVEPADEKGYIQTVNITRSSFEEAPKISYSFNNQPVVLENGKEMVVLRMNAEQAKGTLQKITLDEKPKAGTVAFIKLRQSDDVQNIMQKLQGFSTSGAAAIIVEETPQLRTQWNNFGTRKISFTTTSTGSVNPSNLFAVSKGAAEALEKINDGTPIEIKGKLAVPQTQNTWNTVGVIKGSDPALSSEVILLSAHMDHLGVRPSAPGEDKIFNGADDDASGCIAVLELARVIAGGKRPKRSVYFAFFGTEESGGFGAQYFVNNLPFPKDKLVANLEFEMIGRPDAKVGADELWLTGFDRSNLGPELAKQGAKLVMDPHPEQNFFQRSDNYTLARQGIIAHTVSSFGLHTDYHAASDEIKTIDFNHMTQAINSMVKPVQWLINTNFKPTWNEGKKP